MSPRAGKHVSTHWIRGESQSERGGAANRVGIPSVDSQTDAQMQSIIRSEFSNHTIVMIAHRLSSLLDFDLVAVLDHGRLVELGKPSELLEDRNSGFSRLYHGST